MNTIQKVETGLVALFAAALPDFKVGAAGDQQAMTAYESESGALVIAASEWKQEYPELPDYRVTVHLTGRTSVDADPDRRRITELLTLTQRAAAALTTAQSPVALTRPHRVAASLPKLRERWKMRMRASFLASARIT